MWNVPDFAAFSDVAGKRRAAALDGHRDRTARSPAQNPRERKVRRSRFFFKGMLTLLWESAVQNLEFSASVGS
jgi:hypothetical protein